MKKGDSPKTRPSLWIILLLLSISLGRVSHGLFMGIVGPAMLFMASNVNSSVGVVARLFFGTNTGCIIGSLLSSGYMKRYYQRSANPTVVFGICIIFIGLFILSVPFVDNLIVLIASFFSIGIFVGFFDSGGQALLLSIWGKTAAVPFVHLYHFTFSIGTVLAPFLVRIFVQSEAHGSAKCLTNKSDFVHSHFILNTSSSRNVTSYINNNTEIVTPSQQFSGIRYAFYSSGSFAIISGILLIIMGCFHIEKKVGRKTIQHKEEREEENLRDIWYILLGGVLFFSILTATTYVYPAYLASVAICSNDIHTTISKALLLPMTYWAAYATARVTGTVTSKHIKPTSVVLWSRHNILVLWVGVTAHGFFIGTHYPSAVSWLSRITNISGSYSFIFVFGSAIGRLICLPVSGILFDMTPFYVMYMDLMLVYLGGLVFISLLLMAALKRRFQKHRTQDAKSDEEADVFVS